MISITKKIKIPENPFLLFLPFLLVYIIITVVFQNNDLWGDENRHLLYAQNLTHGFYSNPPPDIYLDCGPGYPVILIPFVLLSLPVICVKLLNAFFLFLSVIFLFKALLHFISFKKAAFVSLFFACYYNIFYFLPLIYSEIFTLFLISALLLSLVLAFGSSGLIKSKRYVYLSGFLMGFIALTKVIFGYVILFMLLGSAVLWILNRKNSQFRKGVLILLISSATVLPYLIYTYQLTGRVFYWATTGGNNLYWMSSPYEGEYGSWAPDIAAGSASLYKLDSIAFFNRGNLVSKEGSFFVPGYEDSIVAHHMGDYNDINKYMGLKRDDEFRRIAFRNIRSNPTKFIRNCFSNIGRILFNTPGSYVVQKPGNMTRLPLNGIIVVLSLFCIIPTLRNWRRLPYTIRFVLIFTFLYLAGSVFGSAEARMFSIIVPLLLCWIAFILQKSVKINIKFR